MRLVGVKISGMHKIFEQQPYLFADATYICGPNGSGKSTILQAIQLGLLGYIPGTNKTVSSIFKHSNSKEMRIELRLYGNEDAEPEEIIIARKYTKSGSKIEEQVTIYPKIYDVDSIVKNLELPILNFNEFLGLTANKQKELLISILPDSGNEINSIQYLTDLPEYDSSCEHIVSELCEELDVLKSVSDIKLLNSKLKEKQSDLVAQEKHATSTVQSLIYYDDYDGSDNVDEIQSQILDLMHKRDEALRKEEALKHYEDQISKNSEFENLADTVEEDETYINLKSEEFSIFDQISTINISISELQDRILNYKSEYAQVQKVLDSQGICPFIEDNCERIEELFDEFKDKHDDLASKIQEANQQISMYNEKLVKCNKQLMAVQNKIDKIKSDYRFRDSICRKFEETKQLISEPLEYTSSELSNQLQILNDSLVKASANQKYNQLMEIVQKQKLELVDQIAFIKAAAKATGENGLQSQVMKEPFEKISKEMHRILESVESQDLGLVKFNLEEKANSFAFGFERDGKLIPFELLSSGEKCIFTLIFMTALVKTSDSLINFILIDDLFDHLDDLRFKTVITNICKLSKEVQIILAGVKITDDVEGLYILDIGGGLDD